jgi:thiol:disulfide interchange protein DsbC
MKHSNSILALALAAAMPFAHAAPDETAIRARIAEINPEAAITSIKPTPIPGLNEVIAGGSVLYFSDNAKYLLHGSLIDIEGRVNLSDVAQASIRRDVLKEIPQNEKIVFKPEGESKHTVTVFTDVSCGYCKKLHTEIDTYLKAGITVEYVAFPRGGEQNPAFKEMQAIWCAKDPRQAYTAAIAGTPPTPQAGKKCDDPVGTHYAFGDRMGLQGTPAIYSQSGEQLGGYLPADQLLARLDAKKALNDVKKNGQGAP